MTGTEKLKRAIELSRGGKLEAALGIYSEVVENDSNLEMEALGHRAWHYRSMGQYEDALKDYERLLASDPKNEEAASRRAETLVLCGRCDEAAKSAVAILSHNPLNRLAARVVLDCQRILGADSDPAPVIAYPFPNYPERPLNPVIEQLEKDPNSFPGSIAPGIGRLLYTFVRALQPRVMVEIGTNIGYSALCLTQGLADNSSGHLHSFDLFENTPDHLPKVRKHLEDAGLARWVTFHKGDSSTTIRQVLGSVNARIDLAFIDGDHTLKGCLKDWYAVDEFMDAGGVALLHDTQPAHCEWLGPRYLLEELGKRADGQYQMINLRTADGCGFGIIQKTQACRSPRWMPSLRELLAQRLFHQICDSKKTRA